MKGKWALGLLLVCGGVHAERVMVGSHAQNERTVVYYWIDQDGQRHFTDDQRKAPKNAARRVVNTPKPAYTPPLYSTPAAPLLPTNSVPPPTSLPPSSLPPLPPAFGENPASHISPSVPASQTTGG